MLKRPACRPAEIKRSIGKNRKSTITHASHCGNPAARHDSETTTFMIASGTLLLTQMRSMTPKAVMTDGFASPHRTHDCRKMYVMRNSVTGMSRMRKQQIKGKSGFTSSHLGLVKSPRQPAQPAENFNGVV